jgi:NADPH-dependent 2,4-dienoyl-CoA reductase/sulfur reductase-like enzyme
VTCARSRGVDGAPAVGVAYEIRYCADPEPITSLNCRANSTLARNLREQWVRLAGAASRWRHDPGGCGANHVDDAMRLRTEVAILGAGLTGAGVALELAARGIAVTLIDQDA